MWYLRVTYALHAYITWHIGVGDEVHEGLDMWHKAMYLCRNATCPASCARTCALRVADTTPEGRGIRACVHISG